MKKLINLGTSVDTGDGDFLRAGASKINDTFDDIYYELGDGNDVFSAGAFKTITSKDLTGGIYFPRFGQSLDINTTSTSIKIHLPKGTAKDFGKNIILRDIFGSWLDSPVEVKPASGDTIKGKTGYTQLYRNYSLITLVYTAKYRWEYVETTQIDQHRSEDLRSVVMNDFIASDNQTDFPNPFGVDKYNPDGLEVYRRGNKLYYGKTFSENSDYGSIGPNGELIPLDGMTIKLRDPCVVGDTVSFTSYIDGIETFRTSHSERTLIFKDMDVENSLNLPSNAIEFRRKDYVEDDDMEILSLSLKRLGIESYHNFNPYSYQIFLNGVMLTRMEDTGGKFFCDGVDKDITSPDLCKIEGGEWIPFQRMGDYSLIFDGATAVGIDFNFFFSQDDILQIVWYNNIIGTTLSVDEIRTEMDSSFVSTVDEYHISNSITIKDVDNVEGLPNQSHVVHDNTERIVRPQTVSEILNMVFGIGYIYMNYYNKESPEVTLGFGKWRRLEGAVIAGFSDDYSDTIYGQNNTFLDSNGRPTPTPGGQVGHQQTTLQKNNIPMATIEEQVLVKDINGHINIGMCMVDPDDDTTNDNMKYSEKVLTVGTEESQMEAIELMQPTTIVSMWVRVE